MRVTGATWEMVAGFFQGEFRLCDLKWCVSRSNTQTFLWRSNCGQEETRCQEEGRQEDREEDREEEGQRHEEEGQEGQAQDQKGLVPGLEQPDAAFSTLRSDAAEVN